MDAKTSRWARRDAVKMLAMGGVALALDGCIHAPSQALPPCVGAASSPHTVFDTHIHIFNGTDLQIAGFLRRSVAPEYPNVAEIIRLLAQPLQDFVWAFSPTAQRELNHLEDLKRSAETEHLVRAAALDAALVADRAETAGQYNEFLRQQLNDPAVRRALTEALGRAASRRGGADAFSKLLTEAPGTALEARTAAAKVDLALGVNVFEYLGRYFNYRYANFYEVVEQYSCHATPDINSFVALMVDFDQPLSGTANPKSPIGDQIPLMSMICELARGRLVALAPYCPFKDIARGGGESIANIRQAWKLPGFVGAKIYPPMGFKAYGNTGTAMPNGVSGAAVDAALANLYGECIKEDAVVVAHAGPSLCVLSGPCETPGPAGWQAGLDFVYGTYGRALRASLGHFGDPLGTSAQSLDWPEKFLTQIGKPSGARLFADLAYEQEVLDPTSDQASINRLKGLLASYPVAYERLLYGSDWLMLGLEPAWRDYPTRMHSVIAEVETQSGRAGLSTRVFGVNARSWLGLDVSTSLAYRNVRALGVSII